MALAPGYLTATWNVSGNVGNGYSYVALGGLANYTVVAGDYLEYDVFWESGPNPLLYIAMDLICTNGLTLRDNGGVNDQNGRGVHPATDLSAVAGGQWYSRRILLSGLVGSTINNYDIVSEADAAGTYVGRFRSMRIINGSTIKVSIYESNTDGATLAAPSTSTGTGSNPGNNGSSLTSLVASPASQESIAYSPASAYGSRSYGGGAIVSAGSVGASTPLASTAAAGATVSMGMGVAVAENAFYVYSSTPPYNAPDVLIGPKEGIAPGVEKGLVTQVVGQATMTATMGVPPRLTSTSAGRAVVTAKETQNYTVSSTSAGRAAFTNNYLGSPARITSTSVGIGGARDQFGTSGKWYLGSSTRMASTSAGRTTVTTYLGSRIYLSMTSAGRAVVTTYLGSPFRVTMTSAGRATGTVYLATPIYFILTSAGRATSTMYLASRIYFTSTAAGRAAGALYLGSPLRAEAKANGHASGSWYLSSPVRMNAQSSGVATATSRLPQIYALSEFISGVGHMTANQVGPVPLAFSPRGVATASLREKQPLSMIVYSGATFTIQRPSAVFMQWGSSTPYYYSPVFPSQDPILMPQGSNGIAFVRIDIDTIPILRSSTHSVGSMTFDGLRARRPMSWTTRGQFPLVDSGNFRHDYTTSFGLTEGGKGSMSALLYQAPAIIVSNGIGRMTISMKVAYLLRWQKSGDAVVVSAVGGARFVGAAGAEGHMNVAGPPLFSSRSNGRAVDRFGMFGRFSNVLRIHGIAAATFALMGGTSGGGPESPYGNMLRYFFIATPETGQFWPRRERFVQPV